MHKPGLRAFLYTLLGLIFGVVDWFYLDWLAHIHWGSLGESILVIPIILAMNFGIWLVPIIPVAVIESRLAGKMIYAVLAGVLTWSCAIFSYYFYYAVLLSAGKLPHLEHLNIFGEKYETFWLEYWRMFRWIILGQFFEWIIIAILGGAIIGMFTFWLYRKITRQSTAS